MLSKPIERPPRLSPPLGRVRRACGMWAQARRSGPAGAAHRGREPIFKREWRALRIGGAAAPAMNLPGIETSCEATARGPANPVMGRGIEILCCAVTRSSPELAIRDCSHYRACPGCILRPGRAFRARSGCHERMPAIRAAHDPAGARSRRDRFSREGIQVQHCHIPRFMLAVAAGIAMIRLRRCSDRWHSLPEGLEQRANDHCWGPTS